MRKPWIQFGRVGVIVFAVFALLGLLPYLQHAVEQGWPGGFFPYLGALLASWVGSLHWYLPVTALAAGIALARAAQVGRLHVRQVVLACVGLAVLSFALRGFVGPHLEHHARLGLLDMANQRQADLAASLRPNDWNYLRALTANGERQDTAALLALIHSTVAFAVLSAIMLPLGIAIGNGSETWEGAARRRATWTMAAGTTAVVYAAQAGAWRVAVTAEVWPAGLVYFGFLTVPLVILLTLVWSRGGWQLGKVTQGSPTSEGVA